MGRSEALDVEVVLSSHRIVSHDAKERMPSPITFSTLGSVKDRRHTGPVHLNPTRSHKQTRIDHTFLFDVVILAHPQKRRGVQSHRTGVSRSWLNSVAQL